MNIFSSELWLNSAKRYGLLSLLFHWVSVAFVVALYLIGEQIEELDYYDPWYQEAPWWHKSLGICFFFLILARLSNRLFTPKVQPLSTHSGLERVAASAVHNLLYVVLIIICCSGYLVSTSKGAAVNVFSVIEIPAIMTLDEDMAVLFAEIHEIGINILIGLLSLHVLGALKHHFFDKDSTLKRILGINT